MVPILEPTSFPGSLFSTFNDQGRQRRETLGTRLSSNAEVLFHFGFPLCALTNPSTFQSNIDVKMTMKDSEGAKKMEELTDTMIISLMQEMKALALSNKEVDSQSSSDETREPSALDEMKNVLTLYEGIIEQLWKIAENIAKTSAVEERHAGTVFMGSSGDGTYVPELSSEFDTYVMEEDSQYELQEDLEAMDADFAEKNPQDRSHMLKVCC